MFTDQLFSFLYPVPQLRWGVILFDNHKVGKENENSWRVNTTHPLFLIILSLKKGTKEG